MVVYRRNQTWPPNMRAVLIISSSHIIASPVHSWCTDGTRAEQLPPLRSPVFLVVINKHSIDLFRQLLWSGVAWLSFASFLAKQTQIDIILPPVNLYFESGLRTKPDPSLTQCTVRTVRFFSLSKFRGSRTGNGLIRCHAE